jgi:hypothetical protein
MRSTSLVTKWVPEAVQDEMVASDTVMYSLFEERSPKDATTHSNSKHRAESARATAYHDACVPCCWRRSAVGWAEDAIYHKRCNTVDRSFTGMHFRHHFNTAFLLPPAPAALFLASLLKPTLCAQHRIFKPSCKPVLHSAPLPRTGNQQVQSFY